MKINIRSAKKTCPKCGKIEKLFKSKAKINIIKVCDKCSKSKPPN